MALFNIELKWPWSNNHKCIKRKEFEEKLSQKIDVGGCHSAMDSINNKITELKTTMCNHFDRRIDDLSNSIDNYIKLLKDK